MADPGLFDLTPTEHQRELMAATRAFGTERLRPAAQAADEASQAPDDLVTAAHDLGLTLLGVPEALGGVADETPQLTTALVLEELAHADLGLAVACLATGAAATALARWGSPAQHEELLAGLVAGTARAALALAEPQLLSDVLRPRTYATEDDGFVLHGEKALVPAGPGVSFFLVGAEAADGPALFAVPADADGLRVVPDPTMGVRAASPARVVLDGVRVAPGARVGDATSYAACVRLARLAWCALTVGTAQAVLDHVTPYVKERQAFGEPIAHRQAVAFAVADIAVELQGMRLLTWRAAARAARGAEHAREVAWARSACSRHGMRIGSDGVQLLGGHGFVKEHPVERWYRDLRAVAVTEGGVLV